MTMIQSTFAFQSGMDSQLAGKIQADINRIVAKEVKGQAGLRLNIIASCATKDASLTLTGIPLNYLGTETERRVNLIIGETILKYLK